MKVKDSKTGEEREETDEERTTREAQERRAREGGSGGGSEEQGLDFWKAEARKWEDRAKANFAKTVGVPWDEVTGNAVRLKQQEEANKTELERLRDQVNTLTENGKTTAREALLLRVAQKKGLTEAQVKRLVGDTQEALETDADELVKTFKGEGEEEGQQPQGRQRARLEPRVRSGAGASRESNEDVTKIVDKMMERTL